LRPSYLPTESALLPTPCRQENFGRDLIYANASGDRIRNRLGVSGDHCDPDSKAMKFCDGFTGLRPNLIFDADDAEQSHFGDNI
jgi:hypothetical protein